MKEAAPTGALLALMAGGSSRRMGRDKALLPIGSETWLAHLAAEGLATGCRVMVVGRERPTDWDLDEVEFLVDDDPGQGPLGGLVTALTRAEGDVLAVACDMPYVDRAALDWLLEAAGGCPKAPAVAVRGQHGGAEPLFAVYRQAVLRRARQRLQRGQRSLVRLLSAIDAAVIEAPAWLHDRLVNINRPDEIPPELAPAGGRGGDQEP